MIYRLKIKLNCVSQNDDGSSHKVPELDWRAEISNLVELDELIKLSASIWLLISAAAAGI